MPHLIRTSSVALILTSTALLMSIPAADSWSRSSRTEWFQYVAQFTCGQFAGSGPLRLVPGFYATAVSLYNANSDAVTLPARTCIIRWKLATCRRGEAPALDATVLDPGVPETAPAQWSVGSNSR